MVEGGGMSSIAGVVTLISRECDVYYERERWVLLKIPRGDIDGVGEVK